MHQVDRHSEMLYEMHTKMTIMNNTMQQLMWNFDAMCYETNLLHFFQNKLYRVYTSLYALQSDTKSLFEYMRALASQELNPMIIPQDMLKNIPHKIETDIKSHTRLKLCEDPETNIWSYYRTIKLTPIVLGDYLMLILTVPLVDQSLHMNLYKVYNLPMSHPVLHVHVQYEIENTYLATVMDGMFITLPTALDVRLCLMMNGHLCMFKQALYPMEQTNWCIYALFINDERQIERNCILKTINRTTNLAYSLDGYLWAISALATERLQIRCVMETNVITIKPPLQIVDIGNVLLAWAMLQQPYLSKMLFAPPPKNPNKWTHSVIFEPQPKIQLTHLSYKVTSFLDFQPFINGFQTVNSYLDNLWADIQNLSYYRYLFVPIAHININPTVNDSPQNF